MSSIFEHSERTQEPIPLLISSDAWRLLRLLNKFWAFLTHQVFDISGVNVEIRYNPMLFQ